MVPNKGPEFGEKGGGVERQAATCTSTPPQISSACELGAHFGLLWVIRVVPEKALLDA
jgi:hypothetical protein